MTQRKLILLLGTSLVLGIPLLGFLSTSLPFLSNQRMVTSTDSCCAMDLEATAGESGVTGMMEKSSLTMEPVMPPYGQAFAVDTTQAIVKNASLNLLVDDLQSSVAQVQTLATTVEGYITQTSYSNADVMVPSYPSIARDSMPSAPVSLTSAYLSVRVPADKLDVFLTGVRAAAKQVTAESVSAIDQTSQKVDMQARLDNLERTETQLQALMKQAKTVSETLEVSDRLSGIRGEIESLTAQLKMLSTNVSYASVDLSLSLSETNKPVVPDTSSPIIDEIRLAVKDMLRLYRSWFLSGIRTAILIAPAALILAVAWIAWHRWSQKR